MADDRKLEPVQTPVTPSQPTAGFATAARLSAATDLSTIEQRYTSVVEIGRGGMGIVYRARDRETDEVVALKVLNPDIAADPQLIERFKSELRLARRITHKNVCRTHELLRFGDSIVISMEYVPGESLRSVLRRNAGVSLRRAVEWTQQICDALSEAHQQGIVHRDLKPENILIDEQGQAKVMDFGLAHSSESHLTAVGAALGTPAYMSPEQVEGKPADARSDLYAAGLILYEMLTGQVTFAAETPVAAALRRLREPPPSPRDIDPSIPAYLEQAVLRCLALDPKERFASAAELKAALVAPLNVTPLNVTPASAVPSAAPASPISPFLKDRQHAFAYGGAVFFLFLLLAQNAPRQHVFWIFFLAVDLALVGVVWPGLGRFGRWFWMAAGAWLLDIILMAFILLRMDKVFLAAITRASFQNVTASMLTFVWMTAFVFAMYPLIVLMMLMNPRKSSAPTKKWSEEWLNDPENYLRLADSPYVCASVLLLNLVVGGLIVWQCLVVPLSVLVRLAK